MSRHPSGLAAFLGAACVGLAGGWWLARQHDRGHQRHLFSPRPYRRLAALGWIEGQGGPESAALLRDYLAWEPIPALRRRARRIAALHGTSA